MSERLKFGGRLRENEIRAKELKLKLTGLITGVRNILDPFGTMAEIDFEMAAAQAAEAASISIDFRATLDEIRRIKKELGEA